MKSMKYYFTLLVLCFFTTALMAQGDFYYCPPCPSDCHDEHYDEPGSCPTCKMELTKRTSESFDGYKKQAVTIKSGDITLNAAYYSPIKGTVSKAAVVIVHGSAPSTYDDVAYYTNLATKMGMSVLAFDKRGSGNSGGVYEYFTVEGSINWFNTLAMDVAACLNWLKDRPELDVHKIGLLGGSQAGWIMPLVASKHKAVKFIISGEGAAVSTGEEDFHSELTGDGDGDGISIAEANEKLKTFSGDRGFDPRNILQNLEAKTLWIFGTADPVIPVDPSVEVLGKLNNPNFDIVMLPFGDHSFYNVKTDIRYDLTKYIGPWLLKNEILP